MHSLAQFSLCSHYLLLSCHRSTFPPRPHAVVFGALQDYPLNPKAMSLGELYGENDLSTNEWTDGVLSSLMRSACAGSYTETIELKTCCLVSEHG